jgi:rhodanese-related sulfurtransferase
MMIQLRKLFSPVPSMEPDQVREFIANHHEGTYTLLDVRQTEEYEKEHIPGAKLIPLPALADSLSELDHEKPIITY